MGVNWRERRRDADLLKARGKRWRHSGLEKAFPAIIIRLENITSWKLAHVHVEPREGDGGGGAASAERKQGGTATAQMPRPQPARTGEQASLRRDSSLRRRVNVFERFYLPQVTQHVYSLDYLRRTLSSDSAL